MKIKGEILIDIAFALIALAIFALLLFCGCRWPGQDQREDNHKIIQTWDGNNAQ